MVSVTVKKLKSGNFGLYIQDDLIGTAKTEKAANKKLELVKSALENDTAEAYEDGRTEGYDEGLSDGEDQARDAEEQARDAGYDEGYEAGKSECPDAEQA